MNCNRCNLSKAERPDCNCQIIASLIRYRMYDAKEIEEILKVIKEVTSERFLGELVIKIEYGHVASIRKIESVRL